MGAVMPRRRYVQPHMSSRAWMIFAAVSTLWGIPYLLIKIAVDLAVTS
jgi:hypothetical protein